MAKTYLDFYNELIGYVGGSLDPSLAKTLIQRAQRDILESRSWSFLMTEGVLAAPQSISAGSISVTQWSTSVTANATAKAALNVADGNISLGTRQFRTGTTGRIYNISAYNSTTGVITLAEQYTETTVTAGAYSVFKCYYAPPSSDFLRFVSVRDLVNARPLRLNIQKQELDQRDPQRTVSEPPVCISSYKTGSDNVPLFELWPTPTSARAYVCLYIRRGVELEDDGASLPPSIPDELLMTRAHYHLAKWAEMNKGRDPGLRATDWRFVMQESLARYRELMLQAKRQDDEIVVQNYMPPRSARWDSHFPPSASALQERDYW